MMLDPGKFISVKAGGITQQSKAGSYDCAKQKCVVGIAFENVGNQNVRLTFGGAEKVIVPGDSFTHFTNYPYLNTTEYRWKFLATPVAGSSINKLSIFTLKISDV